MDLGSPLPDTNAYSANGFSAADARSAIMAESADVNAGLLMGCLEYSSDVSGSGCCSSDGSSVSSMEENRGDGLMAESTEG